MTQIKVVIDKVLATSEMVQDVVAALINEGAGISTTYNDVNNTLVISSTITQYTDELAKAATRAMLVAGNNIVVQHDTIANTLTISLPYAPVNRSGDSMTGHLVLSNDPQSELHATTKRYVDITSVALALALG